MSIDADLAKLGPLGVLAGTWEGQPGTDVAPGDPDRNTTALSKFRERMTFEPIGLVDNHDQNLYGLRYSTLAWRVDEVDPFHQEVGYWLWERVPRAAVRRTEAARGHCPRAYDGAGGHALR